MAMFFPVTAFNMDFNIANPDQIINSYSSIKKIRTGFILVVGPF